MGRELAIGYGKNVRPAGQPHDGIEADIKVPDFAAGRNIQPMQPVFTAAATESSSCSATKKNGDPCKGRPLEGDSVCVFHREAG